MSRPRCPIRPIICDEGKEKKKNAADKRVNVVMSVNGTKHRPRVAVRVGKVTRLCSKDGTVW